MLLQKKGKNKTIAITTAATTGAAAAATAATANKLGIENIHVRITFKSFQEQWQCNNVQLDNANRKCNGTNILNRFAVMEIACTRQIHSHNAYWTTMRSLLSICRWNFENWIFVRVCGIVKIFAFYVPIVKVKTNSVCFCIFCSSICCWLFLYTFSYFSKFLGAIS